jgi:ubiquinone/menaquinone biosynthesis C-methylase UbiE
MGRIAAWCYDKMNAKFEERVGRELRARLLAEARGRVLEIGAGTGANLGFYPAAVSEVVATEYDEAMLARARGKDVPPHVTLMQADAQALPFDDASFDTVTSTVTLCTIPDAGRALAEIRRVLKPDGQFLFGEHVRASDPGLAKWQDRLERPWRLIAGGCHPNRDTRAAMERAGFAVELSEEGELPLLPKLVKPYIAGRARPLASAAAE